MPNNNPRFASYNSRKRKRDGGGSKQLFLRLDDDHKFEGYALFDPDPEAENNTGYIEYQEHWDQTMNRFVPCWGKEGEDGCIYCKAGLSPSTRAMAAFYVLNSNDGQESEEVNGVRLFRLNWGLLQEWWDTYDEDGSTKGQKVRVKCIERMRGEYTTKFFEKDRIDDEQVEAYLADTPDLANLIQKSLDSAIEALKLQDALHEDDDDDVTETELQRAEEEMPRKPAALKGTPVESEDETPEPTSDLKNGTFVITSVNSAEATLTLEGLDGDLYMGDADLVDLLDELTEGDSVAVEYDKDDEGDWVATTMVKADAKAKRAKATKKV